MNSKCRIGHTNDIISLDSSLNYIVSGGVDGIVSFWNVITGSQVQAIPVNPDEEIGGAPNFNKKKESQSSFEINSIYSGEEKLNLQRSIVEVCFHPYY